jgi:hypothetical protein
MSYVCVNRISVSGPGPKVHQFRSDARRRLPYSLPKWTAVTFVAFSLERLCHKSCLPGPSSACIPFDAWHYLASAGPMAEWHGFARIVYELEVKNYEVYELLTPLSRTYSDLCFVDSQISLDSGEIMATYIARDRCSKWILSEARCNAHWERAAAYHGVAKLADAYEDDSVRSDAEEGMLAEALAHWDKRVLRTLRRWSFVRAIATDNRRQRTTQTARNCSKVVEIGPRTVKVLPDPIRRREAQLHSKNAAVHGEPAEYEQLSALRGAPGQDRHQPDGPEACQFRFYVYDVE